MKIITIKVTTLVDHTPDTQIAVIRDKICHTTEIIIITIITINTTDKDNRAKTQTEMIYTDNDQTVTIDIIRTVITEIIEEVHRTENRTTDIIQEIEEQMGIITTITIKTE